MRYLRLPRIPKSRRLLSVLIGTACAAVLAASAPGNVSPHASPSAYRTISGALAAVAGRRLLLLSAAKGVAAVTLDRPVRAASTHVVPDNP